MGRASVKISPEWGAQRVKGLSLVKALLNVLKPKGAQRETSLIESFLYPKKGPGQLWEIMAEEIQNLGGEIRMKTCATHFERVNGNVSCIVTNRGERLACDAVFSSMPVKDLIAALPEVPEAVCSIARELPYRDFITVGLLVDHLKIENGTKIASVNGLVPDTWIYIQERDVRMGRLQIFNNWSPYMVDDPAHHVWIGLEYFCTEGDALWSMDEKTFVDFAVAELRKIDILEADTPIIDSVRLRVKKAYPAYFGSYAHFDEVRTWIDTVPNLWCIGRNGQHRYNNMDHSMLCGIEAVRSLLEGVSKATVWSVNTEEEYHESK